MYLYFDANGVLKEIITDRPFRQGDSKRNKIYVYWEGEHSVASGWVKYRKPDGSLTAETSFYTYPASLVEKVLPDKPLRNLKYFSYDHTYVKDGQTKVGYEFYEITVPTAVLNSSLDDNDKIPTSNNMIVASIRFVMIDSGTIGEIDDNDTIEEMGAVVFSVETTIGILTDTSIDETQYNYLVWLIGNKADASAMLTALAGKVDKTSYDVETKISSNDVSLTLNTDGDEDNGILAYDKTTGNDRLRSEVYVGDYSASIGYRHIHNDNHANDTATEIEVMENEINAYSEEFVFAKDNRNNTMPYFAVKKNNSLNILELYISKGGSYPTLVSSGGNLIIFNDELVSNIVLDNNGNVILNPVGDGKLKVNNTHIVLDDRNVVDGLASTSTTDVLSAKQGKVLKDLLDDEIIDRQSADGNLQSQIDGINAGQNLADIVADLTALNNLSIANLKNGDKVQVLVDSDHDNASTVYRLYISGGTYSWVYIGRYGQGVGYTKSEVDALLSAKADLSNSSQTITTGTIKLENVVAEGRFDLVKKDGNKILAGVSMLSNYIELYAYNEAGTHQNTRVVIDGDDDNSKIHFWTDEHLAMTIENDQKVLFEKGAYVYDSDDDDYYELVNSKDLAGKQDVLTAGTNITIQNNVISASGGNVSMYEHNIYVRVGSTSLLGYIEFTLTINSKNNTPYTADTLKEYLKQFNYSSNSFKKCIGFQYDSNTMRIIMGMSCDTGGRMRPQFRAINSNAYSITGDFSATLNVYDTITLIEL